MNFIIIIIITATCSVTAFIAVRYGTNTTVLYRNKYRTLHNSESVCVYWPTRFFRLCHFVHRRANTWTDTDVSNDFQRSKDSEHKKHLPVYK
jgi:hypothetical protein